MGEDITAGEIGIYLLNRVEVTLKDDSRAEGILQNIAAETITVEGREIHAFGCGGYPAGRGTDRL